MALLLVHIKVLKSERDAAGYCTLAGVLFLPGAGKGLPWCCHIVQPLLSIMLFLRQKCALKSCPSWGLALRNWHGPSASSSFSCPGSHSGTGNPAAHVRPGFKLLHLKRGQEINPLLHLSMVPILPLPPQPIFSQMEAHKFWVQVSASRTVQLNFPHK